MKWRDVRVGDVFRVSPFSTEPKFAGKTYIVVEVRRSAPGDAVVRVLLSDGAVEEWFGEGSAGYFNDELLARYGRG